MSRTDVGVQHQPKQLLEQLRREDGKEAPILRFFTQKEDAPFLEKLALQYVFRQQDGRDEVGLWVNEFSPNTELRVTCRNGETVKEIGRELWQKKPPKLLAEVDDLMYPEVPKEVVFVRNAKENSLAFIDYAIHWMLSRRVSLNESRDLILIKKEELLNHGLKTEVNLGGFNVMYPEERVIQPLYHEKRLRPLPASLYACIKSPEKLPGRFVPQRGDELVEERKRANEMKSRLVDVGAWHLYIEYPIENVQISLRYIHWFYDQLIERAKTGMLPLS